MLVRARCGKRYPAYRDELRWQLEPVDGLSRISGANERPAR